MKQSQVIDLHYAEHRAKVLDVAAFLDRLDRAEPDAEDDVRVAGLRAAIALLLDGEPGRARRMLELYSDPTAEPIDANPGKGAIGVWPRFDPAVAQSDHAAFSPGEKGGPR